MIVYVETNFLLQYGLKQEQHAAAMRLIELSHSTQIDLALPSIAIIEAISSVQGQRRRRDEAAAALRKELAQARRSREAPPFLSTLEEMIGELAVLSGKELTDVQAALRETSAAGRVIDFHAADLIAAEDAQRRLGLNVVDSLVYAAVVRDLAVAEHQNEVNCFFTTDREFSRNVKDELAALNCRSIPSFADGLDFINSRAAK